MKKIKRVTLAKDYNDGYTFAGRGTELREEKYEGRQCWKLDVNKIGISSESVLANYSGLFDIEFEGEDEYFENYTSMNMNFTRYETLDYFFQLAEHLNGDWKYELGYDYQTFYYDQGKFIIDIRFLSALPLPKFNPELSHSTIFNSAKPEMLKNLEKICKGEL
jgi:hypothetical protein